MKNKKYKFASKYATHIIDDKGKTVLDVPWLNGQTEEDWESLKEFVLNKLNSGNINLVASLLE